MMAGTSRVLGSITSGGELRVDVTTLVATRLLVQASSGGGKSWTLRRLLEQTHGLVQHIVLDPEGEFGSLRERYDYVLTGRGGDLASDPATAGLLARRLLELGVSAICDLYELKARERRRFVRLFLESVINAPKKLWHPALIVIDEAHVYCPERGDAESTEAVIDLCTRGRKRGFAAVLATQRLANLSKQAAAQCLNVLVGPTFLDIDRKRAVEILGVSTDHREMMGRLMHLDPGQFYAVGRALSPQGLGLAEIGAVQTHHPEVSGGRLAQPPPPPRDRVKAVLAKLADLPQEAEEEANELVRLRRENAELRRSAAAPAGYSEERVAELLAQRDRAWQGRVNEALALAAEYRKPLEAYRRHVESLAQDVGRQVDLLPAVPTIAPPPPQEVQERPRAAARRSLGADSGGATPAPPAQLEERLEAGETHVLETLARHSPLLLTLRQWAALANRSARSGSWNSSIAKFRRLALIKIADGRVRLTDRGRALFPVPPIPMTAADVLEQWRSKLQPASRKIIDALVRVHPMGLTREEVGAAAECSHQSGSFNSAIALLRRNGLIKSDGRELHLVEEVVFGGMS